MVNTDDGGESWKIQRSGTAELWHRDNPVMNDIAFCYGTGAAVGDRILMFDTAEMDGWAGEERYLDEQPRVELLDWSELLEIDLNAVDTTYSAALTRWIVAFAVSEEGTVLKYSYVPTLEFPGYDVAPKFEQMILPKTSLTPARQTGGGARLTGYRPAIGRHK